MNGKTIVEGRRGFEVFGRNEFSGLHYLKVFFSGGPGVGYCEEEMNGECVEGSKGGGNVAYSYNYYCDRQLFHFITLTLHYM